MMFFANLAVTSFLIWNVGIASNQTPITNPRIGAIANVIYTQNPDICVLQDAFGLNISQYFILALFPEYNVQIYTLQERGDDDITCISYCVLIKKYLLNIYVEPVEIGNTRNALLISVSGIKILVAYLEYADHKARYEQLRYILSYNVDILCGDLNTFFRDVRREYFGNPLKILNHWKQIGLYICSKQVRNMHVSRRVLSDHKWIMMSKNQYSFPLPFFWKTFLRTPLLKRTEWIWKVIFNDPVLDPDNVLVKNPYILSSTVSIITKVIIKKASDHGAIHFEI